MSSAPTSVPWTGAQLRAALVANAIGVVLIVVAQIGTGGTPTLGHQVGWLNLAILGLVVAGIADGALLFFGRRAIGRRRLLVIPDEAEEVSTVRVNEGQESIWVWVPGTSRAHQHDCPLVSGKDTETVDAAAIRSKSLQLCEVCG
jgi:hypothetical protein